MKKQIKDPHDSGRFNSSPEARCDRAKSALIKLSQKCERLAENLTAYDDEHTRVLHEWQKNLIRLAMVDEIKIVQESYIGAFIGGQHPDILSDILNEVAELSMYLNE